MISRVLLLTAAIVIVLGAAIYVPSMVQTSTTSSTTTTSTTATSCTTSTTTQSTTSSLSSTTSTSTSSTASNETDGRFTYAPQSPVKIESVQAITARDSHGNTTVTFQVLFQNIGANPIYVFGGCGSGLSASIAGSSSVIQRVPGGPLCACAQFIFALNHGQNHTSITPGCWSGYAYHILSPGTVSMNMTLQWSGNGQNFQGTNSTSIEATFTFA